MERSCQQILERLDDFLEEKLKGSDRDAIEEHLRRCDRCRELVSMIGRDLGEEAEASPPKGLAEAILERTSGSPCSSAWERICDHVDGLLGDIDAELVQGHLRACQDCGRLAAAVERLSVDLPALAETPPDESLVSAILERTMPRSVPADRRVVRAGDWAARTFASWKALLGRPRLAWEGAYLGTVFLLLLFGLPMSPLSEVPGQVVALLHGDGVSRLERSINGIDDQLSAGVRTAWDASGSRAIEACREVPTGVDRLSGGVKDAIEQRLGTISRRPASMSASEDNEPPVAERNRPEGEER